MTSFCVRHRMNLSGPCPKCVREGRILAVPLALYDPRKERPLVFKLSDSDLRAARQAACARKAEVARAAHAKRRAGKLPLLVAAVGAIVQEAARRALQKEILLVSALAAIGREASMRGERGVKSRRRARVCHRRVGGARKRAVRDDATAGAQVDQYLRQLYGAPHTIAPQPFPLLLPQDTLPTLHAPAWIAFSDRSRREFD